MVTAAPNPSNQLQATELLSQIPFGAVIGGPLKAAVDAQAAAALACYDFISKIGFVDDTPADGGNSLPSGDAGLRRTKVRDITFTFDRSSGTGGGGTDNKVSITVPLLTIMPLPFFRIESMTVNFKASIAALDSRMQSDAESSNSELNGSATVGFALWKVNVGGSVSSKKDSTATNTSKYSVEHTMDISLHAVQDDMPAGLAKLLSIMTDSIAVARG